ncbi:unnamed protein product [Pseudo-nitzschia multistriata]|uniref:Uncharacterized protein n=1 Tax=Pseudo-nitzschia multistriata TaxID=183589 RepID=A0A448YZ02_9STRA|nr:unnamed protein product [Pseudo-nitzschia multistriata]
MNCSSPTRVLTCAYTNRRRNRIHPLTHPNIININDTMNTQTSKLNKPIPSLKTIKHGIQKLSMNNETSENMDLPIRMPKGSTHEKTSTILPHEESSLYTSREEPCNDVKPSIFRDMSDYDHREDMMLLKRASPVYDSDDDEDYEGLPLKKLRTSGETCTLQWGQQLEESSDGFNLMGLLHLK